MSVKYQPKHVQLLFKVSNETVRLWSEEFAKYLSPTANPGKGKHRHFTEADLQVFALVSEMKAEGSTYADIHLSLANNSRGEVPALPVSEVRSLAPSQQSLMLAIQIEELTEEVEKLRQEKEEAEASLSAMKEENIRLMTRAEQAEAHSKQIEEMTAKRVQELTEQLEKAQARALELSERVGREYAQGMIDALERRGDLPKKEG